MTLFRVPLNVFVIILLLFTNYFNPFYICAIVSFIMLFAWLSTFYLIFYYKTYTHQHDSSIEVTEQEEQNLI